MDQVKTKRLTGVRIGEMHLRYLNQMHSDHQVMSTLGGVIPLDVTRSKLHEWNQHWISYNFGLWAFFSEGSNEFVGRGGIRHCLVESNSEVELAYAIMPKFWRQGYATEIGEISISLAFQVLNLRDLACFTLTTNDNSIKVMKKLGFQYEKKFIRGGKPHVFYRLQNKLSQ